MENNSEQSLKDQKSISEILRDQRAQGSCWLAHTKLQFFSGCPFELARDNDNPERMSVRHTFLRKIQIEAVEEFRRSALRNL